MVALTNDMAWRAMRAAVPDRMIFVGVDLGKLENYSAVVVVERIEEVPTNYLDILRGAGVKIRYVVRHAERLALETPYIEVVKRVKQVVGQMATRGNCVLVVDETGVGVPVVEEMRRARMGCAIYPVMISSGQQATGKSVPREELLTRMKMMIERGELEITTGCLHGVWLKRELVYLRLNGSSSKGGGKGGEKDDLALALALACWKARVR